MVSVEFRGVTKRFGPTVAVNDISLTIEKGELFFMLGPSGCGKTTALRMLAGFISPERGEILFDGHDVARTPPHRRNVGMVFQTYALFPHMTVEQNVAYGLKYRKVGAAERKTRVGEILERTRLGGLGTRYPSELSGGQQQRVALARALVIQPDVLLLDEPLSNLDTKLRVEVREEIRRIHNEFRITSLYVTHDQDEALSLADRMAIMRDGRIEQAGDPAGVYARPKNAFVAGFVGETNLMKAALSQSGGVTALDTPAGGVTIPQQVPGGAREVEISVRPESVRVCDPEYGAVRGRILAVSFFGSTAKLDIRLDSGFEIRALALGAGRRWKKDGAVGVTLEAGDVVVLE